MGKKAIIVPAVFAGLLAAAIIAGVMLLYTPSRTASDSETVVRTDYDGILAAVPEDAAVVACFSSLDKASSLIMDDTRLYGSLLFDRQSAGMRALVDTLSSSGSARLRRAKTVVALNFSGNLAPVMAMDAPADVDSVMMSSLADSLGLSFALKRHDGRPVLLFSTSNALVGSVLRHIDGGYSILDDRSFRTCIGALDSKDMMLWANDYAPKFIANYLVRKYHRHSDFFRKAADWTGFSIDAGEDMSDRLRGVMRFSGGSGKYVSLLSAQKPGTSALADIMPASTYFALSIPLSNARSFCVMREEYMDALGQLTRHKRTLVALKAAGGLTLGEWIDANDIREVAAISWISSEGENMQAVLLRCAALSRKTLSEDVEPYAFAGYAAAAFGSVFSLEDESSSVRFGGWVASGSHKAMSDLLSRYPDGNGTDRPFPVGECNVAAMLALDLCDAEEIFRPAFAQAVKRTLAETGRETVTLAVGASWIAIDVDRTPLKSVRGRAAESKPAPTYTPEIPKGPFTVTNCGTGKKNTLYQNDHLSICLRDENGKDLWGVPFKENLCGMVGELDYYANGKIQFLFAAGSKLYLMDRLGRFVKGFPVDLGAQVLLGPDVYDFTGAHGYTVMVLLADGRIERYDLHGAKPSGWLGIRTESAATGLPSLLTIANVRYWLVPTVRGEELYPFAGGARVKDKKTLNQIKK